MDVEIAVDAMNIAHYIPYITDIILFTGDGDFRYLVENLQKKGVRVTVVSSIKTEVSMIADELRKQCDTFIDIADWEDELRKTTSHYEMRDNPTPVEEDAVSE